MRIVKTPSIKELSCPVNTNDMTFEGLGWVGGIHIFFIWMGSITKDSGDAETTLPTSGGKNLVLSKLGTALSNQQVFIIHHDLT